ncbi:M14 family zinc carboxypeptidase [Vallicoccus soli]|uniref:Peptidase M14 n=1 Tax=Vallicoccus soli TaxID=2339232 RepID=A0A3A3ZLK0_9ACTN|nr:M14 family zinc carboxypeptidase [Vallicoccus soli]RJK97052.1 peptidase M14 [Vallicoccus soli]
MTHRRRWAAAGTGTLLAAALAVTTPGATAAGPASSGVAAVVASGERLAPGETALVRLAVPDRAAADRLVASGADVAAGPSRRGGVVTVDVVLTGRELAAQQRAGARLVQVVQREGQGTARYAASARAAAAAARGPQRTAAARAGAADVANPDVLAFGQAYWWTSKGQTFAQVQVGTSATDDPDLEVEVTWRTADGRSGTFPLVRFVDAGEYQFHYALPVPVPGQPVALTAASSLGGTKTARPSAWPGTTPPDLPEGYQSDFIDAYMAPTEVKARIARLGRQYRDLVTVVDLPHRTQGYRRTATAYLGDPATAAVVVESVKFGDQGMNGVVVQAVDPGRRNRPLTARYRDRVLTVQLATGADGAVYSTADDVAELVSKRFPNVFRAFARAGQGAGVVQPSAAARLDDGLDAPAGVSRRPWTVQALRIGYHRDGSRPGVLAYSQEHAREWATPLVTLEFAERLLANARTDEGTRELLEETEVFVIPTVNPDGANYSFYDENFQRKNLDDWCEGAQRDPANASRIGVDINRNYATGSVYDGYAGGSLDCLSGTAAGPAELSEPESRNVIDLARANPSIRYALNVHSYGGYFMWSPGAYKAEGRVTLPRPSIETAASFLSDAKRIVGAIARHRGTVTWPSNTGPVVDVLYSAAGNSADQLYYDLDITAWDFEVGNDLWDPEEQEWQAVGFQPPYEEAHEEAMEYAEGLVELVRIARDDAQDGR